METQSTIHETGMSLADYAKTRSISIQSASQSFRRHQREMGGMFRREGRKTILLPEGIEYMDSCRNRLPAEIVDPSTLEGMKDRIKVLSQQMEDQGDELKRKEDRIRELEQLLTQKDELIAQKDQVIMVKDSQYQQLLLLTTSQKKKGVFQRLREWVTGTDEIPLPGAEKDEIIDG